MLINLAWKNLWRKKSRTFVLIAAITVGLSGGIFSISITEGLLKQRNIEEINQNYSHIQIHSIGFDKNQRLKDTIEDFAKVDNILKSIPEIKNYTSRLKFMSIISTAHDTRAALIYGIDPIIENKVTVIHKCLIDSTHSFIEAEDNSIVMSSLMAQNLGLVNYEVDSSLIQMLTKRKVDKRLISQVSKLLGSQFNNRKIFRDSLKNILDADLFENYDDFVMNNCMNYKLGRKIIIRFTDIHGDIVEEAFKLTGVYKTNNAMFDNMNIFVHKNYLARLLGVSSCSSSEIAIILNDIEFVDKIESEISQQLPQQSVKSFKKLDPMMLVKGYYLNIYYFVLLGFILFALSFGIINTVLMSVVERTKELGMLMAIGMNKKRIFGLIVFESTFVTLIGGVLGMLIGGIIAIFFNKNGIDFGYFAESMRTFSMPSVIYPILEPKLFVAATILVIITGIASSLYPAFRALKLKPSEAIRTDA